MHGYQASTGETAIQLYGGSVEQSSSSHSETCLCCGESTATVGMCNRCADADCSSELDEACVRTGVSDPKNLAARDIGAFDEL